jgi:hypothetical protein
MENAMPLLLTSLVTIQKSKLWNEIPYLNETREVRRRGIAKNEFIMWETEGW